MPFVASAPSPTGSDPAAITNDGWWPDVDIEAARLSMRLDGTVTPERLRDALTQAMLDVNMDAPVQAWASARQSEGRTKLADVPAPNIGGESRLVYLYRHAVYSFTKANLIEAYVDYDTAASGIKRSELQDCAPDQHRRNGRWAVRQLIGIPRSTVELI